MVYIIFNNIHTMAPKKPTDLEYKQLTQVEHILQRSETYVGSTKLVATECWVSNDQGDGFVKTTIQQCDALLRLYIEVLSNCIDNIWRGAQEGIVCKNIKINVDKESGEITISNDGKPIPQKLNPNGVYIPTMIFGMLLTSSNYNDAENRKTSGLNGYGAKLANIFSTNFAIDLFDHTTSQKFTQKWSKNMSKCEDAKIKIMSAKKCSNTTIKFTPDFPRFNLTGFTDEIFSQFKKYASDVAMIVGKSGVKVEFNGQDITIKSLLEYAQMYNTEDITNSCVIRTDDIECVLIPSANAEFQQVSFANGIQTFEGGVHVDECVNVLLKPVLDKINGIKVTRADTPDKKKVSEKKKTVQLTLREVKNYFNIFVNCEITNPTFSSQSKTKLVSPTPTLTVKPADINKILKWEIIDNIKNSLKFKDMNQIKGLERKRGMVVVKGLDDANYARIANKRKDCILCISEGESAKSYIVQGLSVGINGFKGHDYIGILPIKGKFLNPRNAKTSQITDNKEVKTLIQSLNLEAGVDYSIPANAAKLRYGKLAVFADSDVDGFHIIGLLYNFFDTLYPSVLKIPNFFNFTRSPIIKLTFKKQVYKFYDLASARAFIAANKVDKNSIKYYKGLGTSVRADILEDFAKKMVHVKHDNKSSEVMMNTFDKSRADYRKTWLGNFNIDTTSRDDSTEISVENFINNEMINFSMEDNVRSIPIIYDGLKESQRKVFYATRKKRLNYQHKSLKVAQLGAFVAESTKYHHGEVNLNGTIINMAQRFVGANNLPLLVDDGNFGSRLLNGGDAANGRYIETRFESYVTSLFPEADDNILDDIVDDGDVIEKKFYIPIIPTILANGAQGIGTGYSTNIACYNPQDLITSIRARLNKKQNQDIQPWYRGFKGTIELIDERLTLTGVVTKLTSTTYRISELPISTSIDSYKEQLEKFVEAKMIKDFDNQSDNNYIEFNITTNADSMEITPANLKLTETISLSNMVAFHQGKLKRYPDVNAIIDDFFTERLQKYIQRRSWLIKAKQHDILVLKNKIRFITEINNDKLVIQKLEDEQVEQLLITQKYDKLKVNDIDDTPTNASFEYLLNMQIRTLTASKITSLTLTHQREVEVLDKLQSTTSQKMWLNDLELFEHEYTMWVDRMQKLETTTSSVKKIKTRK